MKKLYIYATFFLLLIAIQSFTQAFIDINAGLTGISHASAAWGDYDNDRDPDLLICGELSNGTPVLKLYSNDGGAFIEVANDFTGVTDGTVTWGDYDNDGDLDILATGENVEGRTLIYKNTDESFSEISENLGYFGPYSFACWGDFDNDGDLDPFITGGWQSTLYINQGSNDFIPSGIEFAGLASGRAFWSDMDADGDPDLVLTGDTGGGMKLYIYLNNDGILEESEMLNIGLSAGSIEPGDYDSDGDADILICGYDDYVSPSAHIYRNDGGTFTNIYAGLAPVAMGNATWGDYDSDGDLDVALTGKLAGCGAFVSEIYENLGGDVFNSISAGITAAENSFVSWVDFDGDTDLDLLLSGNDYNGNSFTKIYRNDISLPNFLPVAPQNLNVDFNANNAILTWDEGSDIQTPVAGLTYNLRIGTQPMGEDILSPMSHMSDGFRKINAPGISAYSNQWIMKNLLPGTTYYWSVQTIDNSFAGSQFSDEQSFVFTLTGVGNRTANAQEVLVSPNPAAGSISFTGLDDNQIYRVDITTTSGINLLTREIKGSEQIGLEGLTHGIYLVTIENDQLRSFCKLIIR